MASAVALAVPVIGAALYTGLGSDHRSASGRMTRVGAVNTTEASRATAAPQTGAATPVQPAPTPAGTQRPTSTPAPAGAAPGSRTSAVVPAIPQRPTTVGRTAAPESAPNASSAGVTGWEVAAEATLFGFASPAVSSAVTGAPTEIGMRFTVDTSGIVTALRVYRGPAEPSARTGTLWDANGIALATVDYPAETPDGWQRVELALPVRLAAGETYTVSATAPDGRYTVGTATPSSTGPIRGLGAVQHDSPGAFPTRTHDRHGWTDVVFVPNA